MKFRCDCSGYILEINYTKDMFFDDVSFAIYDIYSPKGRKYKKPKLVSDVVIMNNAYPKELEKLLKYFKKIDEKLN
ncbi:hypothetical protein LCGC14_2029800 [marine sediment metagenome]|uniref:Uncharacterized protein n=1 Tax=marine sediment metagenome TaxID=412755 RepID=A0A0F9HS37_9ZZZZ